MMPYTPDLMRKQKVRLMTAAPSKIYSHLKHGIASFATEALHSTMLPHTASQKRKGKD